MKVLAMAARKGGVGKTTLSIHCAVAAMQAGRRVLLVDTDPHRNLTDWWRRRRPDRPAVPLEASTPGALPKLLAAKRRAGTVDLVVVDTRAALDQDTRAVAELADVVLMPLRPALLDLQAATHTASALIGVGAAGRAAFVLNMCRPRRLGLAPPMVGEARRALARFGMPVLDPTVAHRVALEDALSGGHAVTESDPDGDGAREVRALWKELESRLWPTPSGNRSTSPSRSGPPRRPARKAA